MTLSLPFPPDDRAEVPEAPGLYALADGEEDIRAIADATTLRRALQETAAMPPLLLRRHPRYAAELPAWWAAERGAQGSPTQTVNISSAGLLLALVAPPPPGGGIWVWVETPFGLIGADGRICWTQGDGRASVAGIAFTALRACGDLLLWERLIGQLAARVAHA